jgi:queuine/archaeosine tRNA-ribosyltransferase
MVNAYEIIKSEKLRRDIQAKGGLHEFLNFHGTIFLDSGGFQAMVHKIEVDVTTLLEVYKTNKADYYFSLDYPSSTLRNSQKKTDLTILNYFKLREEIEDVVPVIHPPISRANQEYQAYERHGPKCMAVGGLVPLMLTSKGISNGRKQAVDLISMIRSGYTGNLHVMGLGAPTIIPILEALGCNSTDSASWRLKAAHGKIMLPNGGERYISQKGARFGIVPLAQHEKEQIEKLKGPVLEEHGWNGLENSFKIRALFNAWITLHSRTPRKLNGPFLKLLAYAQERHLKSNRNS